MRPRDWWVVIWLAALLILAVSVVRVRDSKAQTFYPVTLDWTAPGDDGAVGTASTITMFWKSTTPDTTGMTAWLNAGGLLAGRPAGISTWIQNANNTPGPPTLLAGSLQTFAVLDTFQVGVKYWFGLRTCDEAANCSYSNLVPKVFTIADVTAPRAVRDLRVR